MARIDSLALAVLATSGITLVPASERKQETQTFPPKNRPINREREKARRARQEAKRAAKQEKK